MVNRRLRLSSVVGLLLLAAADPGCGTNAEQPPPVDLTFGQPVDRTLGDDLDPGGGPDLAAGDALVVAFDGGFDGPLDGSGGQSDAPPPDLLPGPPDPKNPENALRDSDCDGLTDEEEFSITYPGGKRTDPNNPDSDGDGVFDGTELGRTKSIDPRCGAFTGDADPMTRTVPTQGDTDLDGLPDGAEDRDKNGRRDPGEADPLDPDTDGDLLLDGEEDLDKDGKLGPGETDPLLADSDGDGIDDGVEKKIVLTDPRKGDTDGDTCLDGREDQNQNGKLDPGETDPRKMGDCGGNNQLDTDKDGLLDQLEDANGNGQLDPGETDPKNPDTDGDGLGDGVEDTNRDGRLSLGETDPRRKDSDCDGLIDGPTKGPALGEDQNGNGRVDPQETDPRRADSDGDGLVDGLERGVTMNPDPACPRFVADGDPGATTDPTQRDSDGDGIDDGAEDANQNGKVDPGELNPKDKADGAGPAAKACARDQLRPIQFRDEATVDLHLALPASFTDFVQLRVGGEPRGLAGYDPKSKVTLIAWRAPAIGGVKTPQEDEQKLRPLVHAVGAVTNPVTRTFTSWDGFPAAVATYDQAGAVDLVTRTTQLINALVGQNAGALPGPGMVNGPFKIQLEIAHRSDQSVVTVMALTPLALFKEPASFLSGDAAGGSALAQFPDRAAAQCEPFTPTRGQPVDFLFSVDDSASMGPYQTALANTAAAMIASLNNSSVDWRLGMISSTYYAASGPNANILRGFTRNPEEFRGWLTSANTCVNGLCSKSNGMVKCTSNAQCWIGTGGNASERVLESAARALHTLGPPTLQEQADRFRANATVVVVLLGDADDQGSYSIAQYGDYFKTPNAMLGPYQNRSGQRVTVHGIICPANQTCGETQNNPRKNPGVVALTGGWNGSIAEANSIPASVSEIVAGAIGAAGHRMQKPPIGATVKVAVSAVADPLKCNPDDLPRSRTNGFDFDGVSRSLSLYGACRAAMGATAAVSYRYWIDDTVNVPNGILLACAKDPLFDPGEFDQCKGPLSCNVGNGKCECPVDCGGPPPLGKVCNATPQVCGYVCAPDCAGLCNGYRACNQGACQCECAQNATCPPGYLFSRMPTCGCVCDAGALACAGNRKADPASCSCLCKDDCGGCGGGKKCNRSTCECE